MRPLMRRQGKRRLLAAGLTVLLAATSAAAVGRPAIVGIAHVAVQVSDMAKARAYYGGLLGFQEVFQFSKDDGTLLWTNFKVNDRQYIELYPGLPPEKEDRLMHVALETTDVEALRLYLAEKGIKVPSHLAKGRAGNLVMALKDPFGRTVEFIQYLPGSMHMKTAGQYLSARRISDHLSLVGFTVADAAAADRFYKDILGLSETVRDGPSDGVLDRVDVGAPEGTDYLEYAVVADRVNRERSGTLNYLGFRASDVQKTLALLRPDPSSLSSAGKPRVGRDGRWRLDLFDPDGTRAELLGPATSR